MLKLSFVLLASVLLSWPSEGSMESQLDGRFCTSDACASLSAVLLQSVNSSVNPCDNFYEYACGGFHSRFRYEIDEPSGPYMDSPLRMGVEMDNRLHEILIDGSLDAVSDDDGNLKSALLLTRAVYRSCLRWGDMRFDPLVDAEQQTAAAIGSINALLDHLLGDSTAALSMPLEQLLARAAVMNLGSVLDIGVPEELINLIAANASRSVFDNATKLMLVTGGYNHTSWEQSQWRQMLKFLMSKNVSLAGTILSSPALGIDSEMIMASVASDVKKLFESMENVSQPFHGTLADLELELSSLTDESPVPFNLSLFLQNLQPKGVNKTRTIEVDNMPLLKALLLYFKGGTVGKNPQAFEKRRTQRLTFLILDTMLDFVDLLPARYVPKKPRTEHLNWKGRPCYRQCLETTRKLMEPALAWLYRRCYHPDSLDRVRRVVEATKQAAMHRILVQEWISQLDKIRMLDKVSAMRYYVGHHEFTRQQLDLFYADIVLNIDWSKTTNFGYMLGYALKSYSKWHLEILSNNPLMTLTTFDSESLFSVNAYYYIDSNSLVFPLGILLPPIYSPGYPDFAIYGSFATLVGHEIGHGFAELWNKASTEPPLSGSAFLQLEPETEASYLQRVQCIQNEFSQLRSGVYGNETLAEDISDIVGLSAAYRAYIAERSTEADRLPGGLLDPMGAGCGLDRRGVTWRRSQAERLFFIMVAQPFCTKATQASMEENFRSGSSSHSAGPVRVNGMLRSSADFARVFQCPAGSPMNPTEKCVFW